MTKYIFSIVLLILNCLNVCSQTAGNQVDGNRPIVNVHSPAVASLMKAIDNPVALYSGTPDISHTLYTLKDGTIEIPIILQYNASGIKVTEESSWIGLSWNLNIGGMIVQNIVGKDDYAQDFKCTYPDNTPTGSFPGYAGIPYRVGDKGRYDIFYQKALEARLQPDVFYFSYPGGVGKFFIDYRDNSFHLIDDSKDIQIERIDATDWKITTEDGTQHFFTTLLPASENGDMMRVTSRTSVLDYTIYPNGQTVSYYYSLKDVVSCRGEQSYHYCVKSASGIQACGSGIIGVLDGSTEIHSQEAFLDSITTDNYIVAFKKSNREDFRNGLKLDEIEIRGRYASKWGNMVRKFCFSYDYFVSSIIGNYWSSYNASGFYDIDRLKKRLKLCSVYEVNTSNQKNDCLYFDYYNSDALPVKTSYAMDYWGYYNGRITNTSMIPSFRYLLWGQNSIAEKYQLQKKPATRACNPECLHNGMLKSITYATGGRTEYVYEPHEFTHTSYIPTWDELQHLDASLTSPVADIIERNSPSDLGYVDFFAEAQNEIQIHLSLSRGLNEWRDMVGSKYTLMRISPNGGIPEVIENRELNLTNVSGNIFEQTLTFTAEKSYNHRLYLYIPEKLGNQFDAFAKHGSISAKVYVINHAIEKRGYSRGGGLRVKQVNYYGTSGSNIPVKSLEYVYPLSPSGGMLFTPIAFHYLYQNLVYGQTYIDHNGKVTYSTGSEGKELTLSSSNFHSAPYSITASSVNYYNVLVRHKKDGAQNGHTEYSFVHAKEVSANCCYQIPETGSGKPSCVAYYDASGKLLRSENFTYTANRTHFYTGVTIIDHFNRTPQFYTDPSHGLFEFYELYSAGEFTDRFQTFLYSLCSTRYMLTQKTIYQNGMTTAENYTYDNHCQLICKDITNSDGKVYSWRYSYPYNFNCGIYNFMTNKHMYRYPVEEKIFCNGKMIGGKLTQYKQFIATLGRYLPSSLSSLSVSSPANNVETFSCSGENTTYYPSKDITYLHYDAIGNPVAIKHKEEEIIYLWGYGYQYPIAEIRGSSYSNVASKLGCAPESLSSAIVPDMAKISALRTSLSGAHVTTYTYRPLVGIISMTAPGGEITNYEYDNFGRLVKVRDHNGKAIEDYEYHYKP